ncbi:MAG: hypothetical protein ACPGO3_13340 [Magnetospiraceae bacterium]
MERSAIARNVMLEINQRVQAWINGSVPNDAATYDAFVALCTPDFSYVGPGGGKTDGPAFLEGMRGAHGSNPDFRLNLSDTPIEEIYDNGEILIAEVIEMQDGAKAVAKARHARRITAIFLADATATHGYRVLRLHETMIPEEEEAALDWTVFD